MFRPAALLGVLLLPVLAGCVAPPAATAEDAPAPPIAPLAASLGGIAAEAAPNASWWIMEVDATPEGGLAAFRWTVPAGAEVPWPGNEFLGVNETTILLEVAPILPNGSDPRAPDWLLMGIDTEGGTADVVTSVASMPLTTRDVGPLGEAHTEGEGVDRPTILLLGMSDFAEGEELAFVLGARSASPEPFGLAFRVRTEAIEDLEVAETTAAFLAQRDAPPASLAPIGAGSGLHLGLFFEVSTFMPPFATRAWERRGGAMEVDGEVDPDLRPVAARRQQRIHSAFETERGWSTMTAIHFGAGEQAGTFAVKVDRHGETYEVDGPLVSGAFLTPGLTALPLVTTVGEGAGGAGVALDLDLVERNTFLVLVVAQLSLGETLETLVGVPAKAYHADFRGVIGQHGVHAEGDALVIDSGAGRLVLPDALRGAPDALRAHLA